MGTRTGHFNGRDHTRHRVRDGAALSEIAAFIPIPFPARAGMEFLLRRRFHFAGRPAFIRGARPHAGNQRFADRIGFCGRLVGQRIGLRGHQLYFYCLAGRGGGIATDRDGLGLDAQRKSTRRCLIYMISVLRFFGGKDLTRMARI